MYLPSDQACNAQNSETPLSPAVLAASQALTAAEDASVNDANANWNNVISRVWQSFADLGPYVALQLVNNPAAGTSSPDFSLPALVSGATPATNPVGPANPSGVSVVSPSNPGGSGPVYSRRQRGGNPFLNRFGGPPVLTYTGPLPPAGSVGSLVYGGAARGLPVGPGVYATAMPNPLAGAGGGSCPTYPGVNSQAWGAPAAAATGLEAPGSGAILAVLGVLALAGLGYWAEQKESRKRRAA